MLSRIRKREKIYVWNERERCCLVGLGKERELASGMKGRDGLLFGRIRKREKEMASGMKGKKMYAN